MRTGGMGLVFASGRDAVLEAFIIKFTYCLPWNVLIPCGASGICAPG